MRRRGRSVLHALFVAALCLCAARAAPFEGQDTHDADYAAREAGPESDSSDGGGESGGLLESLDADYAVPPPGPPAATGSGYPPAPPRTPSGAGSDEEVTHFADARDNRYVLTKAAGRLAQMELLEDMALI